MGESPLATVVVVLAQAAESYRPEETRGCFVPPEEWFGPETVDAAAWIVGLGSLLCLCFAFLALGSRPVRAASASLVAAVVAGMGLGIAVFRLPIEAIPLTAEEIPLATTGPVLLCIALLCAAVGIHQRARAKAGTVLRNQVTRGR